MALAPATTPPYFQKHAEIEPAHGDAMTTARDIINADVTCIGGHETLIANGFGGLRCVRAFR
jgi:hypothetical protein